MAYAIHASCMVTQIHATCSMYSKQGSNDRSTRATRVCALFFVVCLCRVYAALHLVALYLVIVVLSPLHTAPSDPEPPAARLTLLSAQPAHILTASNLAPLRILGLDDVELLRYVSKWLAHSCHE